MNEAKKKCREYLLKDNSSKLNVIKAVLAFCFAVFLVFVITACSSSGYKQISQDEAMQIMQEQEDYLIVDVRRPDEFAEAHISGAINVPVEAITTASDADELSDDLPEKSQMLLIYCRSGNRSKEASQKLADMGYTNIYEFGGISTWKGEIVTEEE